jgi:hypothetical protein
LGKKNILHFTSTGFISFGMFFASLAAVAQQTPAASVPSQPASQTTPTIKSGDGVPSAGANQIANPSSLPDSPSAVALEAIDKQLQPASRNSLEVALASPRAQESQTQESQTQQPQSQVSQSQEQGQQSSAPVQKPVGTAVAETPNASGIAASQPAGVAIAPAKQHRVRTIVLRTGAIVGAGVAVGAIVALTAATPSKPPGAH